MHIRLLISYVYVESLPFQTMIAFGCVWHKFVLVCWHLRLHFLLYFFWQTQNAAKQLKFRLILVTRKL